MISLCIISRKEDEEVLNAAIDSVWDYVGQVVVINTGEEALNIRERSYVSIMDDDTQRIVYKRFKWTNDFAAARNFSFAQATGDVILWLDSDDVVKNPKILPVLAEKIEKGDVDWVFSEYIYSRDEVGNITARHWVPRMMKKGSGHWMSRVHESFVPDKAVIQEKDVDLFGERLIVEHQKTSEGYQESAKRNLEIQLKEIKEEGAEVDPRTLLYTGMSYQALKEYDKAIPYYIQHIKASGSKEDKYWSAYRIGLCYILSGQPETALTPLLDSLKLFPEWQSSYFLLAAAYSALEQYDKVIEWTLAGRAKDRPDTLQVLSDLDYTILPMARLAEAYLHTGMYDEALETAEQLVKVNPQFSPSKELLDQCREAVSLEKFVLSFMTVASEIKNYDRVKATQLFDLIPKELDDDIRIQRAHGLIVPPKQWDDKSVVIYCGKTLEEWSFPSIFTGIGGSEEAVINISKELASKGYAVTVYNRCGDMKGTYDGVEYRPYYHFNPKDHFNVLIGWRSPQMFMREYQAKKKYLWLHDIAYPEQFNEKIVENVDKILFLSQWHRKNLPDVPDEKVYITNNGINPKDFETLPPKKPNSLLWSSSYDRGLLPFIKNIWPLVQKEIPDVTLDVAYGWQNIEKEMDQIPSLKKLYTELSPILENTPGITHHGRLSHKKLAQLMGECMVYPYASEFGETNNITSQKCQAARCAVITTSQAGGTPERVIYGFVLTADKIYTDKIQQQAFASTVIYWLKNDTYYDSGEMDEFSWSTTTNNWIKDLL